MRAGLIFLLLILFCLPLTFTGRQQAKPSGNDVNLMPVANVRQSQATATVKGTPATAAEPTLSINDVTLTEDSCQNKNFVFTVTLSKSTGKSVTVQYATADGSPGQTGTAAVANKDYVPVAGTLTFSHSSRPNGPQGSQLATIIVPLGNYVTSSPANETKIFTVTLSHATNASITKPQGVGAMLNPASSCLPAENGSCFVNYCGAARSCTQVNRSAAETPYAELAGLGITPIADPNFEVCHAAGLWTDTDGDGFSDAAEAQAYIDVNGNGIDEPEIDVPLPEADPNKPDVYLHYDYVAGTDHDHNPPPQAIQLVVEAFVAHGVNLHIDPQHYVLDESATKVVTMLAQGPNYTPDPACAGPSAQSVQQLRATFSRLQLLKPAYHYVVFGHYSNCDSAQHCLACAADQECGEGSPPPFGALGSSEISGNDSIVSLGVFTDNHVAIPDETVAGVLLHELGHNLGLKHGGADCDNYKPNYLSVMNYSFYTAGIPVTGTPGDDAAKACVTDADCGPAPLCPGPNCETPPHCSSTTHRCYRLDYSTFQYNDLNESALDEVLGLSGRPNSRNLTIWTPDLFASTYYAPTNGAVIDWNRDGTIGFSLVDLNGDGSQTALAGWNDWANNNGLFTNLNFCFQVTNNFHDEPTWSPTVSKRLANQ